MAPTDAPTEPLPFEPDLSRALALIDLSGARVTEGAKLFCRTLPVNYRAHLAPGIIEKDNRETGSIPSASFCRGDESRTL